LSNVYTLGNLLGQPRVWIAIVFTTDSSVNRAAGVYVDNVVLRRCNSPSCSGVSNPQPDSDSSQIVEVQRMMKLPR
jgi:hypothetical protein